MLQVDTFTAERYSPIFWVHGSNSPDNLPICARQRGYHVSVVLLPGSAPHCSNLSYTSGTYSKFRSLAGRECCQHTNCSSRAGRSQGMQPRLAQLPLSDTVTVLRQNFSCRASKGGLVGGQSVPTPPLPTRYTHQFSLLLSLQSIMPAESQKPDTAV
jgi:hypothetical protein